MQADGFRSIPTILCQLSLRSMIRFSDLNLLAGKSGEVQEQISQSTYQLFVELRSLQ